MPKGRRAFLRTAVGALGALVALLVPTRAFGWSRRRARCASEPMMCPPPPLPRGQKGTANGAIAYPFNVNVPGGGAFYVWGYVDSNGGWSVDTVVLDGTSFSGTKIDPPPHPTST